MTKNAITLSPMILDALKPTSYIDRNKKLRHDGVDGKGEPLTCSTITDLGCKNLTIRTTAGGKSWSFNLKVPKLGINTKAKLGVYTHGKDKTVVMGLDEARREAERYQREAKADRDPRPSATAVEAVAAPEKPTTIAELITERLASKKVAKLRGVAKMKWRYENYIIPKIGDVAVRDFKIATHWKAVIKPLTDRGRDAMACVIHRDLYALLKFAVNNVDDIEHNKMAGAENPYEYEKRSRVLANEEIRTLWHNVRVVFTGKKAMIARILLLEMVLGQRSNEIAQMREEELHLDGTQPVWVIPKERVKNKREHEVPLPPLAIRLIRECIEAANGNPVLFAKIRTPSEPITSHYVSNEVWKIRTEAEARGEANPLGVDEWTPHDLRRTMVTVMEELGVSEKHQSLVVNHMMEADGGPAKKDRNADRGSNTTKIYRHHRTKHYAEKLEALTAWTVWLERIVTQPPSDNVVPMKKVA